MQFFLGQHSKENSNFSLMSPNVAVATAVAQHSKENSNFVQNDLKLAEFCWIVGNIQKKIAIYQRTACTQRHNPTLYATFKRKQQFTENVLPVNKAARVLQHSKENSNNSSASQDGLVLSNSCNIQKKIAIFSCYCLVVRWSLQLCNIQKKIAIQRPSISICHLP